MRVIRLLALFGGTLTVALCAAPKDSRPPAEACSREQRGQFWPSNANNGSADLQHYATTGELWLCRQSNWSTLAFRWEKLTVSLPKLKEKAKRRHEP